MYLVAIAWLYVVTLMALAEALSAQGSVLGALMTFLLYGVLPLALVLYLLATPMRRRARLQADRLAAAREPLQQAAAPPPAPGAATDEREAAENVVPSGADPDRGSLTAGDAGAAERKEI